MGPFSFKPPRELSLFHIIMSIGVYPVQVLFRHRLVFLEDGIIAYVIPRCSPLLLGYGNAAWAGEVRDTRLHLPYAILGCWARGKPMLRLGSGEMQPEPETT